MEGFYRGDCSVWRMLGEWSVLRIPYVPVSICPGALRFPGLRSITMRSRYENAVALAVLITATFALHIDEAGERMYAPLSIQKKG
jgi:hypothetical protein